MCGIFGFITTRGEGPDVDRLQRIALVTQRRGEHAFGLAWLDAGGKLQTFKRQGPAERYLELLDHCRGALAMVGHCRLATHGSPADHRNNHPHVAGRGCLVHNGVVRNYRDLIGQYALRTQSRCDSEVLGLLMARCPGTILQRAAWAAGQAEGDLALLGIWRRPTRLLVCRRGRPLHVGQGRDGFYFASLPEGLPGRVHPVANGVVRLATYSGGRLQVTGGMVSQPVISSRIPWPALTGLRIAE